MTWVDVHGLMRHSGVGSAPRAMSCRSSLQTHLLVHHSGTMKATPASAAMGGGASGVDLGNLSSGGSAAGEKEADFAPCWVWEVTCISSAMSFFAMPTHLNNFPILEIAKPREDTDPGHLS